MTTTELWNRGNNLVATVIVALSGIAFLPEFFTENEWSHKLDEVLLFLLAIRAIYWYKKGNNRFTRSILPVVFVIAAFAIKILALVLEFSDKEDVGDDFGALILFALASVFMIWLYKKAANKPGPNT